MQYFTTAYEFIGYKLRSVTNYCENGQVTQYTYHALKSKKQFLKRNCQGDTLVYETVIDNFLNKTGYWIYRRENLNKKTEGYDKDTDSLDETGIKTGK